MKVLLLNDTSAFHSGSKAVVDSLCSRILQAGHVLTAKIPMRQEATVEQIRACDMLIVNGEGSMRFEVDGWDIDRHAQYRRSMTIALKYDKMVCLTNTVWHRQSDKWGGILKACHSVSVRELSSAEEMERQFGITPLIHPDESWFWPITECAVSMNYGKIVIGGIYKANTKDFQDHNSPLFDDYTKLTLNENSFDAVVNGLYPAKHYITGQHHGVYAALKAGCQFIPILTNTHKIPGLFRWAGVEIPVYDRADTALRAEPRAEECFRLLNFLREQKPWAIPEY